MNQTQRKFLIERIQTKTKDKINALKRKELDFPSASNYIFQAILNGTLELVDKRITLDALTKKAKNAKEGSNWLSDERMGFNKERTVQLALQDLIVLPKEYDDRKKEVMSFNSTIFEEVKALKMHLDTVEVRVQLASDKVLQGLINEVDDMGDLSLVDTKLKLLSQ
jgi:hypothetical protein